MTNSKLQVAPYPLYWGLLEYFQPPMICDAYKALIPNGKRKLGIKREIKRIQGGLKMRGR